MTAGKSYKRDQVVSIINSVLGKIQTSPLEPQRQTLAHELVELKEIIDHLRRELHAARPADITSTHIPSASDELDAVVGATEEATQTIMESCETILGVMNGQPPEISQQVENLVVKVFEACTFQDVTGQRIKKVMNSLKQIDAKIRTVLSAIDIELDGLEHPRAPAPVAAEQSLLNGPALPKDAVSQDEIDKLLAEFDAGN